MMKDKVEQSRKIFTVLREQNPNPTTELKYSTPFELLVAVVLSAQSTDVGVNNATAKLYAIANTPEKIWALGTSGLEGYIRTIGLYKTKAKNIIALCKKLIEDNTSTVPNDYAKLIDLPGVGRKTANVILNTLFAHEVIAVDTHIFRVSNRLGIAQGKTPLAVENKLYQVIPKEFKQNAHHWLILHGRYVCRARSPKCTICKVQDYCDYYANLSKTN